MAVTTFGLWKYNHGGDYSKPALDEVLTAYRDCPHELKVLLSRSYHVLCVTMSDPLPDWVLDAGFIGAVEDLKDVVFYEDTMRKYVQESARIKNQVQPIV